MSDKANEQAVQAQAAQQPQAEPTPPQEPERVKDTRRILQGVQFPEGGEIRTYADGDEDALERVLTAEDVLRLKHRGAIEGNWRPRGKGRPPMTRSPRGDTPGRRRTAEGRTPTDEVAAALRSDNERLAQEAKDAREAHAALLKRVEALEGRAAEPVVEGDDGLDALTVPELRDLARDRGVDLRGATKKDDIVAAMRGAR